MTKKEFFWCLDRCEGIARLEWRDDGDGWINVMHNTLLCFADKTPDRNSKGKCISALVNPKCSAFIVDAVQGGDLISAEKNKRMANRSDLLWNKYSLWLKDYCDDSHRCTSLEDMEKVC